jgi:hypothetical protein
VIGVVHLVWGPLGPAPLRRFLASYRAHRAGADHELVILWNGTTPDQRAELSHHLVDVPHVSLTLADPVQDLAAYREASDELSHARLCFLNSHSVIGADDWLAKLDAALPSDGPAIVGATGSWMSVRSAYLHLLGLSTAYRGVLPPRRAILSEIGRMNAQLGAEGGVSVPTPLGTRLELAARRVLQTRAFPTAHVRTNAFLLGRELFSRLVTGQPRNKLDAYGLEAGPHSLTAQVLSAGGRVRVVDSEGSAYGPDAWNRSATFWQPDQDRLMVADNQTRLYTQGSELRRQLLAGWAWGEPGVSTPRKPVA